MKDLMWAVIPLTVIIIVGLLIGFAIELVVYFAPFIRIILFCGAALSLLSLPFFVFKKLRYITGWGFISLSFFFGAFTYIDGFTTSHEIGGRAAVIIGTLLMVYGVVLVAIFLSAVNGAIVPALIFLAMVVTTYAFWKIGEKILIAHKEYMRAGSLSHQRISNTDFSYSDDNSDPFDDYEEMPEPRGPLTRKCQTELDLQQEVQK